MKVKAVDSFWKSLKRLTRKRPLHEMYWWVRYRTTDRNHVVRCDGLRPGYWEVEDQMLHAMFGLLRDYVECQCAHMQQISRWLEDEKQITGKRSRADGITYLDWASALVYDENAGVHPGEEHYGKPTGQAEAAKETKALYLWWVDERPARPEGKFNHEIEEKYHAEDEQMMKRLVAIRRSLWT